MHMLDVVFIPISDAVLMHTHTLHGVLMHLLRVAFMHRCIRCSIHACIRSYIYIYIYDMWIVNYVFLVFLLFLVFLVLLFWGGSCGVPLSCFVLWILEFCWFWRNPQNMTVGGLVLWYIYIYIYVYIYIWGVVVCFDKWKSPWAVPCHSRPAERSRACSERSDKVRDCKLNTAQAKARTWRRLQPAHKTD